MKKPQGSLYLTNVINNIAIIKNVKNIYLLTKQKLFSTFLLI